MVLLTRHPLLLSEVFRRLRFQRWKSEISWGTNRNYLVPSFAYLTFTRHYYTNLGYLEEVNKDLLFSSRPFVVIISRSIVEYCIFC